MNKIRYFFWKYWPLVVAVNLCLFIGLAHDNDWIGKGQRISLMILTVGSIVWQSIMYFGAFERKQKLNYDYYINQRINNINKNAKLKTAEFLERNTIKKGNLSFAEKQQ